MKKPHLQVIAFLIWLFIVPPSFYLVYTQFPFKEIDVTFLLANFVMLMVALSISFKVVSTTVSVERWIIFVVFFQYGLFAEMVFMQVALILLQFFKTSSLPPLYRFSTNSLMFTIVSFSSATAFYLAGGRTGDTSVWAFTVAAIVYALTYSIVNSMIILFMEKIEGNSLEKKSKLALWDLNTTLLFIPLSIAYSLLTDQINGYSVLLLGMPFLLILFIIRKYAFSGELHEKLLAGVEIGHELTESLKAHDVIKVFIEKVQGVVRYDQLYLLDIYKQKELQLLSCSEAGTIDSKAQFFGFDPSAIHKMNDEKIIIYSTSKEIKELTHLSFSPAVQSVMVAPVIRAGKVEGYLVLTSFRRNFFEKLDKRMLELLAGYFETSIVKASHYEQTITQSERCGLTKLHNFRYLTKQIATVTELQKQEKLKCVSAIILDIDHFKMLNDTYGHQSGNDILVEFANLLKIYAGKGCTLARYGGEEFVLVLPNYDKKAAAELAEQIRQKTESHIFEIQSDLDANYTKLGIQLTISLGVSSIPEDTKSGTSLLRNADRALYIGGKQAGRNKVGVYNENESNDVNTPSVKPIALSEGEELVQSASESDSAW